MLDIFATSGCPTTPFFCTNYTIYKPFCQVFLHKNSLFLQNIGNFAKKVHFFFVL